MTGVKKQVGKTEWRRSRNKWPHTKKCHQLNSTNQLQIISESIQFSPSSHSISWKRRKRQDKRRGVHGEVKLKTEREKAKEVTLEWKALNQDQEANEREKRHRKTPAAAWEREPEPEKQINQSGSNWNPTDVQSRWSWRDKDDDWSQIKAEGKRLRKATRKASRSPKQEGIVNTW